MEVTLARNGSGTYTAPVNSVNPAVAATTIDASDFNDFISDLETAMSASIANDGQTATSASIPFANGITTDTIGEASSNVGVTVDSVLLKDGGVQLGAAGTVVFEGATANAFETTVTVTDPTADNTVTIQDATDTLVGRDTTDTLTNKTLTSPTLTTPTLTSAVLNTAVSGTAVLDEDNMASDSATQLATQQSIKAYVDAGGVTQAVQAGIEAETNEDTYIPPDLLKFSPGVAKAWCEFNGTGVPAVNGTAYNVASIDDNGVGDYGVNFTTGMSSGSFAAVANGNTGDAGTRSSDRYANVYATLAGSVEITTENNGTNEDFALVTMVAFGDFA